MNLFIRLFWLLLSARWRKRVGVLDDCELQMHVLPNDIDINLHLTNARYLSLMDLGRIEFILQTGTFKKLLKRGWLPVVATAHLQFKRQIKPFQKFTLKTRVIAWDDKWVFMEQRFETEKGLAAIGVVKVLFRSKKGNVPSKDLLRLAGYEGESPELPAELAFMKDSINTGKAAS